MKGKSTFSRSEADVIIALIKQKLKASSEEQKKIRAKIRAKGFYASDFGLRDGYTEQDFTSVVIITGASSNAPKEIKPVKKSEKRSPLRQIAKLEDLIESLPPVADNKSAVLILGTMPGQESLKQQFYYCNSRNLFWPLIQQVLGKAAPFSNEERKNYLLKHKIALWDVCKACIREGSLDANISEETPNDLTSFLKKHPSIRAIAFNGAKAEAIFRKHYSNIMIPILSLPSTSPANASISLGEKRQSWSLLSKYLVD